ncbi:MAG TPA: fatty acid--CoA ligase family protein [Acidimicrobiia bacterium]|nr:fatty acid--CoA ligase family protein [Acidimicrobiia bacterium]
MPAGDEAEAVAVLLPPPELARAAVALWDAGEAVVPLDPAAPAADVHRSLAALRPTVLVDGDGRRPCPGGVPVPAGVAAVVATSGTTGERKGVDLTFAGLAASASAVTSAVGAGPGDGWLCCLPLHLVAGLAVVGRAWATGAPVAVHAGFDPEAVAEAARTAPFVSLVPTMLRRLLAGGSRAAAGFHHILLGGGPIDPGLLAAARDAGAVVSTTYGMTETWGGVAHNGHPLEGVELRVDPARDGGGAGDDAVGEILVRAPMLMRGYRLWPEGTAAAVDAGGWYRTGDLGRFDPEAGGRLRVLDRLGDVVNTGGVKVSPTEVERVLAGHPAIADVCVAGRPDPDWGERVVAFVVPAEPSAPPPLEDLRAFARRELPAAKLPREVVVVPAIPRTAGGKALRRLLPGPAPR